MRKMWSCVFALLFRLFAFPLLCYPPGVVQQVGVAFARHVRLSVVSTAKWVHPVFLERNSFTCPARAGGTASASTENALTCEYVPNPILDFWWSHRLLREAEQNSQHTVDSDTSGVKMVKTMPPATILTDTLSTEQKESLYSDLADLDVLIFSGGDGIDIPDYHRFLTARESREGPGAGEDHETGKTQSHGRGGTRRRRQRWVVSHRENNMHPNNLLQRYFQGGGGRDGDGSGTGTQTTSPEQDYFDRVVTVFSDPKASLMWSDLFFLPRPANPAKQKVGELLRWHRAHRQVINTATTNSPTAYPLETTRRPRTTVAVDGGGQEEANVEKDGDYLPLPYFLTFLDTPTYAEIQQRLSLHPPHEEDQAPSAGIAPMKSVLYISRKYGMSSNRDYWAKGLQEAGLLHARGECFLQAEEDYMDPVIRRRNSLKNDWLERYRDPRYWKQVDVAGNPLAHGKEPPPRSAARRNSTSTTMISPTKRREGGAPPKIYRFYLAAHNTNCRHYVDEKLVKPFFHGLVPIVVGLPKEDLNLYVPRHSYIHVDDFANVNDLAHYLQYLEHNDTALLQYHEWRKAVDLVDYRNDAWPCVFCQAVAEGEVRGGSGVWEDEKFGTENLHCVVDKLLPSEAAPGEIVDVDVNTPVENNDGLLKTSALAECGNSTLATPRRRPMDPHAHAGTADPESRRSAASLFSQLDYAQFRGQRVVPNVNGQRPDWEWRWHPAHGGGPSTSRQKERPGRNSALLGKFDAAFFSRFANASGSSFLENLEGGGSVHQEQERGGWQREWAVMRADDCVASVSDLGEDEDAPARDHVDVDVVARDGDSARSAEQVVPRLHRTRELELARARETMQNLEYEVKHKVLYSPWGRTRRRAEPIYSLHRQRL